MAKKSFTAAVSEILAGETNVDQAVADLTAPEAAPEAAPEVTVLEPGLAKGLTPHETEQALHAMGKEASPVAAAAAAKTGKRAPRPEGQFSMKATHPGKTLTVVDGKARKSGGGVAGLEYIRSNPGITFEDWAAQGFGLDHLNWDINRGWVILGDANDDGLGGLRKAISLTKEAAKVMAGSGIYGEEEFIAALEAQADDLYQALVEAETAAQENAETEAAE